MTERPAMTARRVCVTGRVQGVGFRAWTAARARAHGLSGWVRNERDGSVTALISGGAAAVEAMLDEMRQGPDPARVDDLAAEEAQPPQRQGFEQRR